MSTFPTRCRTALPAALVALLAALPAVACSSPVPGSAAAGPASAQAAEPDPSEGATPPSERAEAPEGDCEVTIRGPGSIRISGGSNRVVTRNQQSSFSCAGGQMLAIEEVADGAVTFAAEGGGPVRIAAGETAEAGGYEITVATASGDSAQFVVSAG